MSKADLTNDVVARAFTNLARTAPVSELPAIIDQARARAHDDPWQRGGSADVLLAAGSRCNGDQASALVEEALQLAWSAATEVGDGVETLASAMQLADAKQRAWLITHLYSGDTRFRNASTKREILGALAPLLMDSEFRRALDAARELPDEERAKQLMKFLPRVAAQDANDVLHEIASAAASVGNDYTRTEVLAGFADILVSTEPRTAHTVFRSLLALLARRRRSSVVTDLPALAPIIYRHGALRALEETQLALREVADWWP